jgi:hypothetical protein
MRLMQYDENDNIIPADQLYFDGYEIGERQLEGEPIKVTLNAAADDIVISADWPPGACKTYWTPIAKKFALQHDIFSTTAKLDNDDGFIEFDEVGDKPAGPVPRPIMKARPFG